MSYVDKNSEIIYAWMLVSSWWIFIWTKEPLVNLTSEFAFWALSLYGPFLVLLTIFLHVFILIGWAEQLLHCQAPNKQSRIYVCRWAHIILFVWPCSYNPSHISVCKLSINHQGGACSQDHHEQLRYWWEQ